MINSNPGRPESRDWAALKPEIERHLEAGDGFLKLAKRYGVSAAGMRGVLARLGLGTRRQKCF
jgi:hypothetical protein